MKYDKIYEYITGTKAFGVTEKMLKDGQHVGISNGVKYLINHEPHTEEEIIQALEKFYNVDFGTMYDSDYEKAFAPTQWEDKKAFGEYTISTLDEPIYIHYEPHGMSYDVVIYLKFER